MARTGIALGSNLGERLDHLRTARVALRRLHQGPEGAFRKSSVYETAPVDCPPGSQPFLNAVIDLETDLSPLELLDALQDIERTLGRPDQREKNSPRTVDLDLLCHGDTEISHPRLELPHPRLTQRRFVLVPLEEITPPFSLPGIPQSISELLTGLPEGESDPLLFRSDW